MSKIINKKRHYLVELRRRKKMSQKDVANLFGITQTAYCSIEIGYRRYKLPLDYIIKLAEIFKTSVNRIIKLETEYQNANKEEKEEAV